MLVMLMLNMIGGVEGRSFDAKVKMQSHVTAEASDWVGQIEIKRTCAPSLFGTTPFHLASLVSLCLYNSNLKSEVLRTL